MFSSKLRTQLQPHYVDKILFPAFKSVLQNWALGFCGKEKITAFKSRTTGLKTWVGSHSAYPHSPWSQISAAFLLWSSKAWILDEIIFLFRVGFWKRKQSCVLRRRPVCLLHEKFPAAPLVWCSQSWGEADEGSRFLTCAAFISFGERPLHSELELTRVFSSLQLE